MFEALGVAGIAISVVAYVPQVIHLGREHCSAGVSTRAWTMWLAGSVLVGVLAVHRRDPVFILLEVSSLISAAAILVLARRYRGMLCETHRIRRLANSPDVGLDVQTIPPHDLDPPRKED